MTTAVTVAQLRNLTDRAGAGLTPDEQQRLRDGIDALHAERADAWQKFATVAAQRDRLRTRMNTLADRWDLEGPPPGNRPLTELRAEISIEPFGTDDTPSPATPTRTHIWDGGDLPDWLTGHRWDDEQLVIRTPDGDTRPQAGWWLIRWSDGTITAASPTSGERVYGDGGLCGQLERAEHELNQHAEAEAADIAAGSYAGHVEELEAELARLRPQLARAQRIAMDILDDGPADRVRALHQPMPRGPFTICAHCSGWDGKWRCLGVVTDYPCPTLQALDPRPADDTPPAEPEPHVYLSTGCLHGDHAYCQNMTGLNGAKRPGECKFCRASCRCECHATVEQPGPAATQATEASGWLHAGTRDLSIPDPLTPDGEARLAQDGIDTPGCDCGHDGMGVSWHRDDCPWRRSVVDCPGRPTPS